MVEVCRQKKDCFIILAALLALFLGALDALVVAAAMPTIVAELSGLHLFSWVYSAYFLARAVSLPVFGKIADRYNIRTIFLFSIVLFLVSSLVAGYASSMYVLVVARGFQGMGSGGIFALVYIVLSAIGDRAHRGRIFSFASSIWGIASVVGPTLGGIIVTYMSWRWIFWMNIPIAMMSILGIWLFFHIETQVKKTARLDIGGIISLSGLILSFLLLFIIGSSEKGWFSTPMLFLGFFFVLFGLLFWWCEQRTEDPVLDIRFFRIPDFALGNSAVFFASFAIFSLFAYAPLFIQGALGKTPVEVGISMVSLSLGWSCGSLLLGQIVHKLGERWGALLGGILLVISAGVMLLFTTTTTIVSCFLLFLGMGGGMGFITLSTLLLVQNSVSGQDLGVSTSFHQFARTLGGTVGVGVCGGIVTGRLSAELRLAMPGLDGAVVARLRESAEVIFQPDFLARLTPDVVNGIRRAISLAMGSVFWVVSIAAFFSCLSALVLWRRSMTK
jgi:EmrB/QacA subfamily drug resistance transporter